MNFSKKKKHYIQIINLLYFHSLLIRKERPAINLSFLVQFFLLALVGYGFLTDQINQKRFIIIIYMRIANQKFFKLLLL